MDTYFNQGETIDKKIRFLLKFVDFHIDFKIQVSATQTVL